MAIIKCRECGKMVSSEAPFCPHCGLPVEKQAIGGSDGESKNNVKQNQIVDGSVKDETFSQNHQSATENSTTVNIGNNNPPTIQPPLFNRIKTFCLENKKLVAMIAGGLLILILIIALIAQCNNSYHDFSYYNSDSYSSSSYYSSSDNSYEEAKEEVPDTVGRKKYSLVIYKDETGDFFDSEGGHIAHVKYINDMREYTIYTLSIKFELLDDITNQLVIYSKPEILFSSQDAASDFEYHNNKGKGVDVTKEKKSDRTIYSFWLKDNDIEKFESIQPHDNINTANENSFTIIAYSDESGHLFGSDGKHICGAEVKSYGGKDIDFKIDLNKNVEMWGKLLDELYIGKGKVYENYYADRIIATYKSEVDGDLSIYTFPKQGSSSSSSKSSKSTSSSDDRATAIANLEQMLADSRGMSFGDSNMEQISGKYLRGENVLEFRFIQRIFPKEEADASLLQDMTNASKSSRVEALRGSSLVDMIRPLKANIRDVVCYPDGSKCYSYTISFSEISN